MLLPARRSVLQPLQATEKVLLPTENATAISKPADAVCDPVEVISQGHSSSIDTVCQDASPAAAAAAAASPGKRHHVGPESTWAVRQSAELEGLQAALNRQSSRRGRRSAGPASSSETEDASQDQSDDVESRQGQLTHLVC